MKYKLTLMFFATISFVPGLRGVADPQAGDGVIGNTEPRRALICELCGALEGRKSPKPQRARGIANTLLRTAVLDKYFDI